MKKTKKKSREDKIESIISKGISITNAKILGMVGKGHGIDYRWVFLSYSLAQKIEKMLKKK